MGATVLTGKAAAAFARPDTGEILYVLFERTYEKNCYPHEDHWGAIAFGNYVQVMRRVFMHAGVCEGGMLQSRAGWIAPENYIKDWQKHLRKPFEMRWMQMPIRLRKSDSFFSPIRDDAHLAQVNQVLQRHEKEWMIEVLSSGGEVVLELDRDIEVVTALYGEEGPIRASRAFDHGDIGTIANDGLGFAKSDCEIDAPVYQVWHLADKKEGLIASIGGSLIRNVGWAHSAIESFILNEVYPREMERTGCAKEMIQAFRQACKDAPVVPQSTIVKIDFYAVREPASKWHLDSCDRLVAKLGLPAGSYKFMASFADIVQTDALYELTCLRPDMLEWDIQDTSTQHSSSHMEAGQLSLL